MSKMNYYVVLDLHKNASQTDIRQAYRQLSKVYHPDRIPRNQDPKTLQQAHEKMSLINEAYAVLGNVQSRYEYDKRIQDNEQRQNNHEHQTSPRDDPPSHSAVQQAMHCQFSRLSPETQTRLLRIQSDPNPDAFRIAAGDIMTRFLFLLLAAAGLFSIIGWGHKIESGEIGGWILFIGSTACSLILCVQAVWIQQWYASPLKPMVFFTPLYFIKTQFDDINYRSRASVRGIRPTHHYQNSIYRCTTIEMDFPDGVETVTLDSKKLAEVLLQAFAQWTRKCIAAYERHDIAFFLDQDFFRNEQAACQLKTVSILRWRKMTIGAIIVGIVIGIGSFAWKWQEMKTLATQQIERYAERQNKASEPRDRGATLPKTQEARISFTAPAQTLPSSGLYRQHTYRKAVAPLTIITRGNLHNFVKIYNWQTNVVVATAFIRAGEVGSINVPLGSYCIKFAAGKIWYGEQYLFGPETAFSSADGRFDFAQSGNYIEGYTLELFLQPNGNLHLSQVSADDF